MCVFQGKESPGVIDQLLDVEKNPRRPQYVMAADFPLNLFHCQYDEEEVSEAEKQASGFEALTLKVR